MVAIRSSHKRPFEKAPGARFLLLAAVVTIGIGIVATTLYSSLYAAASVKPAPRPSSLAAPPGENEALFTSTNTTDRINQPAVKNNLNCKPILPDLPEPDVPHTTSALSDLTKMRNYILREQGGIDSYYKQQDALEAFIWQEFHRKPSVLELGGNNGWFADPLFPIMMAHEWPAIIIEALPHQFARLVSNYGKKYGGSCLWEGLHLINMAVLNETKEVKMTYMETRGWQRGGGSVLLHHDEPGWKTMMVPGDTLENILLDNINAAKIEIDLVQIDVEGLDEELLRQVDRIMDSGSIYPRMLCLETCIDYCIDFFEKHSFETFRAPGQVCGTRDFVADKEADI